VFKTVLVMPSGPAALRDLRYRIFGHLYFLPTVWKIDSENF
jgi:hypothetical protein